MSLFNSYDRTNFLGEILSPLDTQLGVLTPQQQRNKLLANIFGTTVGFGYPSGLGVGGAVTQATSKSTGVTLNTLAGAITTNAASLAANTSVSFTFTNSNIGPQDVIAMEIGGSAADASAYNVVAVPGTGSATVVIRNLTAGALAEAIVLNFVIIKGANS